MTRVTYINQTSWGVSSILYLEASLFSCIMSTLPKKLNWSLFLDAISSAAALKSDESDTS
jgi:hypothetical protein